MTSTSQSALTSTWIHQHVALQRLPVFTDFSDPQIMNMMESLILHHFTNMLQFTHRVFNRELNPSTALPLKHSQLTFTETYLNRLHSTKIAGLTCMGLV